MHLVLEKQRSINSVSCVWVSLGVWITSGNQDQSRRLREQKHFGTNSEQLCTRFL
jgi:hypothetical protein